MTKPEREDRKPAILHANLLILVSIMLILTLGSTMQLWSVPWGLLGTELLLILLPTLAFLWLGRLRIFATLRLVWPGGRLVLLGIGIGIALSVVARWLDTLAVGWFGYSVPLLPGLFPATGGEAALLFVALAVSAPLCEEVMFRGYVQRAYERLGPFVAIVVTGLIFALFHLRFQGLLAVLPIAFVLGYVFWRGRSLWPAIAVHFGVNALAAGDLIALSLAPDLVLGLPSTGAALAAAGLIVGGLWLFSRLAAPVPGHSATERWRLSAAWPLLAVGIIYVAAAGLEYVTGRYPAVMAAERLELRAPVVRGGQSWTFEVRNVIEEAVGMATCQVAEAEQGLSVSCVEEVDPFELRIGGSYWSHDGGVRRHEVEWAADDLSVRRAQVDFTSDGDHRLSGQVLRANADLSLAVESDERIEALELPGDALLAHEWPWRLTALNFRVGSSSHAQLGWYSRWRPELESSGPLLEETLVQVHGAEPVTVPAGRFIAWRVTLSQHGHTAWYDVNAPHQPLRFGDGFVSYVLAGP